MPYCLVSAKTINQNAEALPLSFFCQGQRIKIKNLRQTETVNFAVLGRVQHVNGIALLVSAGIESPAVAIVAVIVPHPVRAFALFLVETTRYEELVECAAGRLAELIGHIWRAQCH